MLCERRKIGILFLLSCYWVSTTAKHEIASKSNNYVGWRLLDKLFGNEEQNTVFSPFGVNTLLCLVFQGIGTPAAILFNTILTYGSQRFMANQYKSILYRLLTIGNVTLNIATSIYLSDKFYPLDKFVRIAVKNFNTDVKSIDFRQKKEVTTSINNWVKTRTQNTITKFAKEAHFDDNAVMALINAIYFQGDFAVKFDPTLTILRDFHVSKTETIKCETMFAIADFEYANIDGLGAEVLLLPYEDKNIGLVIILPLPNEPINNVVKKLEGMDLYKLLNQLVTSKLVVYLPKFKIERELNLNESLKELGLGELFEKSDNFKNLTPGDETCVSHVIQKAVIEVNEFGTDARAGIGANPNFRTIDPRFVVDHPFIFGLVHQYDETRTLLFLGKIGNPNLG